MQVVNYSDFRHKMKAHLDNVSDNHDVLIVPRGNERSVVIISLEEYNSIQETLHLMRSEKNRTRLMEALERANNGNGEKHDLIEE
ncbi:antitoxin YefM [Chitinophaga ginsengisegetis]|uniref:Antitoxin n=1 Tax=Chitinophaga ginsengisegetis TaxID=393003 RepID=A0A1T5PD51_9BACT|nr:type II toxin-antitoxin system prevent-host-death family antitoxin [Chitinophaga ginsengisegetis]MDR6570154.1 antitoxin YefM [Chitinophaga ginsengisegetis]MDR6649888.1 antitoxin YefM [Chitinophaga ginsengisegetis]MDR6656471.1 antitoxin YefM [Chitinophaga ginsengisegetis]SKD10469.1 antitoxin YefM [Chitinophaga ginsengisegetis]